MLKYLVTFFSAEYVVLTGIVLFIIVTPNVDFFVFDQQRIFQIGIIFFTLGLSLINPGFRRQLIAQFLNFSYRNQLLLLSIFILAVFSAISAALPEYALLESSLYCGLFFLSLSVAHLSFQKKIFFQAIFFSALIISSFFYQIIFFAGYLASFIENMPLQWPEPFGGFINIRFFNQYHLWLFFLISAPLLIYPNLDGRLLSSIKLNAIGWAILLFVSGSRGALVAVFLTLLIVFFVFKRQSHAMIKLNLFFLGLGFIGALLLFKLLPQLLESQVVLGWRSVEELTAVDMPRLYLGKIALNYMISHPWLGIGAMHYAYYPNLIAMHPHNSVLQWGAEMGLPSLIIVITLLTSGLQVWVKRFARLDKNSPDYFADQQVWVVLFCSMAAGLIYSLVDGVIVMPVSQVLMVTIAGWMFGLYFQAEFHSESIVIITKTKSLLTLILTGIILIILTYTVMPTLVSRLVVLEGASAVVSTGMRPRFWLQGEIGKLENSK